MYAAWRGAFTEPETPSDAAAEWHDRWLPGLERHLAERWRTGRCDAEHTDRGAGAYGAPIDDPSAYAAHVGADLRARQPKENPVTQPTDRVPAAEMAGHLAAGRASSLGGLPGSPVRYRDAFWRPDGAGFTRIDDPDVAARLSADADRLAAGDTAVDEARGDHGERR